MAGAHATFHPLAVRSVEPLTDEAVCVTFEVPPALRERYRFVQGQHLTLRCALGGSEVRRSYSICSSAASGELRVAVKRLPGGLFSEYAHDELAAGNVIDVMTPVGRFHVPLDPRRARHYAAIAAGSGITPILSLIATTLETEPASSFTLLYGNRSSATIMFLDELHDLKDRWPARFTLIHVLSREDQDVQLLTGRLDRAKLGQFFDTLLPPDTVDEWFLCGPFPLVVAARELLVERGVAAATVHLELFHVDGQAPAPARAESPPSAVPVREGAASSSLTLRLDGRATTVPAMERSTSLLEAGMTVRSDLPYACRGGVCGTCRALVLEGAVAMDRNYALEPDDVAAGFVLTCQAHPRSDHVWVDYDA